ncbi:hypothetical protein [Cohnella mopanensis]|uniref:hypothetical protein n=1 Tax=Cohnella mopanensis TaxID=2911966 RepID=UPI001EF997E0|nr:hypothetical protein [Cohnella mopanensis]
MKYGYVIVLAALLGLTGCSSSPSTSRYIEAQEPTIEPTESASEQPAQADPSLTEAKASPTQAEPTRQTEEIKAPASEKASEPAKKQTKAEKVQEAKKNNESIGKAVTDSILDKVADQETEKKPETSALKKPIEQIRSHVKDLKQHAEDDDADKMKDVISQIAQDWEAMKADVEASYPDMVDFLQEKIVKLNELQSAETIDSKAILQLDYELYQALRQLADKAGI